MTRPKHSLPITAEHLPTRPTHSPPITGEAQENKLITLAMQQAEKELLSGKASSQVLTHFLRLATERAKAETAKIALENSLLEEKIAEAKRGANVEDMYGDVMEALKTYTTSKGTNQ